MGAHRHSAIALAGMLDGHEVLNPPPSVDLGGLPVAPPQVSAAFSLTASPLDEWKSVVGAKPGELHI